MKKTKITIVGAGLAGTLLATYLGRRGFAVEVYERRPDMRKAQISAGRSINLALSTRGIHALREVGVLDNLMKDAIPMPGRMIHPLTGELAFQPYGKSVDESINSISRGGLNIALMDAAEASGRVRFFFNQRCVGVDFANSVLHFRDESSGQISRKKAEVIFACDGAFSAVRSEMMKSVRYNFSQDYLAHGYKELTIPSLPDGGFRMEKHALHIWPRGSHMLIALPNPKGSFTCTLFLPFDGKESFAELNNPANVLLFFENQFPDAVPLLPNLKEEFFGNPTGDLVTIRAFPWFVNDSALLLGDAAHAIVPFYGQGMNCAFEDCTVLNECVERHGDNWAAVFSEFQNLRKQNADAIAQLALDNFIEMRDKVADPVFLMKKALEIKLEQTFPGDFLSTYARVTFHRAPYTEALEKGRVQDRVLINFCQTVDSIDEVDLSALLATVNRELQKAGLA